VNPRVGPFELIAPIGVGGMGVVWRAQAARGPVAVKFLTAHRAREARFLASFRAEVRATASLEHPNIVPLYDQGLVADDLAMLGLVPGSPWLAMAFGGGGSLQPWLGRLPWSSVRSILAQLLDALAHAHAAGLVHRDVKPENVLLRASAERDPRVMLTDFGLAHAVESDDEAHRGGTPEYMAPEQARLGADLGPWTDLYAVGRVALALVTGAPRDDEPAIAVPEGWSAWVARLVQRNPSDRWERAADASLALRDLPDVDGDALGPIRAVAPSISASTWLDELPTGAHTPDVADPVARRIPGWTPEPPHPLPPPSEPVGAGLGLWGLRPVPLVDRSELRAALWEALGAVMRSGKPAAVVLEGPEGCGKTRLAEWLARRAHEAGLAGVVRAEHGPTAGRHEGLTGMVARALRCAGRGREGAVQAATGFLASRGEASTEEALALAELAHPAPEGLTGPRVRFASARERYVAAERFLERLGRPYPEAGSRALLVVLDDVAWGPDAIAFAAHLLRSGLPVLVVLTVHDEALADRTVEQAALNALIEAGASRLPVGPLPASDRPRLVREILDLDDDLARRVVERTAGNALFAVQLVGDWVERGLLVPGPQGFRLREGATVALPADLVGVWDGRVARLGEGDDARALEIAAVLGQTVDDDEWYAACRVAGITPSEALLEDLFGRRLAIEADAGWSFVHPMLREAVVRRAEAAGTLGSAHLACAEALRAGGRATAERRGRHLWAAGRLEEAVEPFGDGIAVLRGLGLIDAAEAATRELRRLLELTGLPSDAEPWGWYWTNVGRNARLRRNMAEAVAAFEKVVAAGHRSFLASTLLELARSEVMTGAYDAAHAYAERAERAYVEVGRPDGIADAVLQRVEAWIRQGRFDDAEAGLARALTHVADEESVAYLVARQTGAIRLARSDAAGARVAYEKALAIAEKTGRRTDAASVMNGLGECARIGGDPGAAERWYRASLERFRACGSGEAPVPLANLGILLEAGGRRAEAEQVLSEALDHAIRQRRRGLEAPVRAALLPCTADRPDVFAAHLARVEELVLALGLADRDVANAAERAAQRLPPGPLRERALGLAERQKQALGAV
jgi:tetratricopeptide (TPR) repeat protein